MKRYIRESVQRADVSRKNVRLIRNWWDIIQPDYVGELATYSFLKWEPHQSKFRVTDLFDRPVDAFAHWPGPAKVNDRVYFNGESYPDVQAHLSNKGPVGKFLDHPVLGTYKRKLTGEFYLITSEDGVDYYMTLDKVDSVLKSPVQRRALPDRFLDAFEYIDEA